jgi:5-methyltetrahydrofolate--homocysteine methyltransferase
MALGRREFRNVDLGELARCIDWGPFFQAWELSGPFPAILDDAVVGEAARNVYAEGQAMLREIVAGRWLTANGAVALLPANSVGDDIEMYTDESRANVALTWHNLRQQNERPPGKPNYCLSDFVAPKASGVRDYVGAFAVTTGLGIENRVALFEAKKDDYSAIMLKALADRLAEAFAEYLHARVRREFWGYAADECLSNDELIAEKYRGIRPAPGYPACPDHRVKRSMFEVLKADEIGMDLTESLAMTPAASVSGFYLAHPEARYFNVGKIADDQLQDWARHTGLLIEDAQRALAPIL